MAIDAGDVDLALKFHRGQATFTVDKLSITAPTTADGPTSAKVTLTADNTAGLVEASLTAPQLLVAGLEYNAQSNAPGLVVAGKTLTVNSRVGELPGNAGVTEVSWRYVVDDSVTSLDTASLVLGPPESHQVTVPVGKHPAITGWNGAPAPQSISGTVTAGPDTVTLDRATVLAYGSRSQQAPAGKRVLRVYATGTRNTEFGANSLRTTLTGPDGTSADSIDSVRTPNAAREVGWPISPATDVGIYDFVVPDHFGGTYTLTYQRDSATATTTFTLTE